MDKKDLKEFKKAANEIKALFNIGKVGITDTFIDTVDKYLEVHGMVKIRCSACGEKSDVEIMAKKVADVVEADVVDVRGFTFTLAK